MATFREVVFSSLLVLFLLGSVAGVVIGVGLITNAEAILAFLRRMNRWQTTWIDTKAREERPLAQSGAPMSPLRRRIFGTVFILGGGGSAAVLLTSLARMPTLSTLPSRGAGWAALLMLGDAVRWFLMLGCAAAAVLGVLLLFFPDIWAKLETRANRWHSTQQVFTQSDVMHMPLDHWIERSPRPAGALIAVLSLVATVAFATLLLWHR